MPETEFKQYCKQMGIETFEDYLVKAWNIPQEGLKPAFLLLRAHMHLALHAGMSTWLAGEVSNAKWQLEKLTGIEGDNIQLPSWLSKGVENECYSLPIKDEDFQATLERNRKELQYIKRGQVPIEERIHNAFIKGVLRWFGDQEDN